eukprot:UN10086
MHGVNGLRAIYHPWLVIILFQVISIIAKCGRCNKARLGRMTCFDIGVTVTMMCSIWTSTMIPLAKISHTKLLDNLSENALIFKKSLPGKQVEDLCYHKSIERISFKYDIVLLDESRQEPIRIQNTYPNYCTFEMENFNYDDFFGTDRYFIVTCNKHGPPIWLNIMSEWKCYHDALFRHFPFEFYIDYRITIRGPMYPYQKKISFSNSHQFEEQ